MAQEIQAKHLQKPTHPGSGYTQKRERLLLPIA